MGKRNYTLVGITPRLAKIWEKDFRDDLRIVKNEYTKEIQGKLTLNIFEAVIMKIRIMMFNMRHPYVLDLICDNGKRYRV